MKHFSGEGPVNVGVGEDLTIAELAKFIAGVAKFRGRIVFDPSRPDGTPRKLVDVSRLNLLAGAPGIPLADGIRRLTPGISNMLHRVRSVAL